MTEKKEEPVDKKTLIFKKNNLRQINHLKTLMDKRKEQRAMTIYNLANSKFQTALIIARQLLFNSQKIWKGFNDEYCEQFEQNFFFTTSKSKQHTQFLLDNVLICKVFMKSKKKDDILEIIEKIEIPEVKIIDKNQINTKAEIIKYNQMKEVLARTCAALLAFIQVTKHQKISEYTEKLFESYCDFVQKYYGPFQYATARFMYANYLYENQKYKRSLQMYEICLRIRKQNCLNEGFVDVLVNSAICMRQIGRIKPAIERMRSAIETSKDLKKSTENVIDDYHLFLAKLYMQDAQFQQSYKNYLITYKLRSELDIQNPQRVEIQLNLLYFYKVLQRAIAEHGQIMFINKDRKFLDPCRKQAQEILKDMSENILNREQFAKYDDFNKKMAHLNLVIPEAFFDLLSSEQVLELNLLLLKLSSCSFPKGVNQLFKSSLLEEKKAKQILLLANPQLLR